MLRPAKHWLIVSKLYSGMRGKTCKYIHIYPNLHLFSEDMTIAFQVRWSALSPHSPEIEQQWFRFETVWPMNSYEQQCIFHKHFHNFPSLFHTFSIHFLYMFHHVPSFSFIFHTFSIHVPSCSIMFHHVPSFSFIYHTFSIHVPSFSIIFHHFSIYFPNM